MGPILVTGANGFVGSAVINRGALLGLRLRASARQQGANWPSGVEFAMSGDIADGENWRAVLDGVAVIVHCAARVHVVRDKASGSLSEFRRVNVVGTLNLARQAADAMVRRFIYISSIGVNGAETFGRPFAADDNAAPHSPYAVSKNEAELGLRQIARGTGMEVVIIRPPLVIGPGAPGNLNKMLHIIYHGIPLPLGSIHNRRSLVALDNLVHLIMTCLHHPAAANQTFLVSDGEDLSTTALLRRIAVALGRPVRLIAAPAHVVRMATGIFGTTRLGQQLCGSLQVDIGKTRNLLDWRPAVSVEDALNQTARYFLANLKAAANSVL